MLLSGPEVLEIPVLLLVGGALLAASILVSRQVAPRRRKLRLGPSHAKSRAPGEAGPDRRHLLQQVRAVRESVPATADHARAATRSILDFTAARDELRAARHAKRAAGQQHRQRVALLRHQLMRRIERLDRENEELQADCDQRINKAEDRVAVCRSQLPADLQGATPLQLWRLSQRVPWWERTWLWWRSL